MNSQTNIEGLLGKPLWQMTGRAMQEKDVKYTDKNGRTRVRKGSSSLREGVAIIMENTTMGDLNRLSSAESKVPRSRVRLTGWTKRSTSNRQHLKGCRRKSQRNAERSTRLIPATSGKTPP